ncbi:SDR family NAD(P)-dependent oxidoreductase [Streptomyces violaceusniger]|uniref:Short-chain dehydrogenase/reductase SDR n=1 Tax=Streptomyces violaceusniger (strain Tu 4113) TaxID=653045 RepID=G2NUB1_STRV4|nr:SDR family NAD(P)-dependent oxidoreductase [Streptomyces violaceusniger]AEM84289.1 short-chain dehydrogenase/reductase SDR [Streptomyces violaceusniger Tu 4113]
MTKWTAADLPDMSGRTVVITGASGGIGLITARELARVGADVVLAVRTVCKGQEAAAKIPGRTEVRELDVSDLASVRRFANEWTGPIDVLINNAGIMNVPLTRTADGFDAQMATNYFGPFALTNLLLPHLRGRVVSVSSQLHRLGKPHLEDLTGRSRPYKSLNAYYDSKLNIVLFSTELQRRLTVSGSTVKSIVAHPGIASTNLVSHTFSGRVMFGSLRFLLNDAEHGALPSLFAATQDIPGNSYVGPNGPGSVKGYPKIRKPATAGLDPRTAMELWTLTAQLTGTGSQLPILA